MKQEIVSTIVKYPRYFRTLKFTFAQVFQTYICNIHSVGVTVQVSKNKIQA